MSGHVCHYSIIYNLLHWWLRMSVNISMIVMLNITSSFALNNAQYLRTQFCLFYRCHKELDTPQQLHPSAKSHLQVLWQADDWSYDTCQSIPACTPSPSPSLISIMFNEPQVHLLEKSSACSNICSFLYDSHEMSPMIKKWTKCLCSLGNSS